MQDGEVTGTGLTESSTSSQGPRARPRRFACSTIWQPASASGASCAPSRSAACRSPCSAARWRSKPPPAAADVANRASTLLLPWIWRWIPPLPAHRGRGKREHISRPSSREEDGRRAPGWYRRYGPSVEHAPPAWSRKVVHLRFSYYGDELPFWQTDGQGKPAPVVPLAHQQRRPVRRRYATLTSGQKPGARRPFDVLYHEGARQRR